MSISMVDLLGINLTFNDLKEFRCFEASICKRTTDVRQKRPQECALVLGKANYNNDFQAQNKRRRYPQQQIWYGESANQTIPEDLHTTAPEPPELYPNFGNLRTEPLSHQSFIWAETPKLTLLWKKHTSSLQKNKMQPTNLSAVM